MRKTRNSMTNEEKDLYFKDLCFRLPYHPVVRNRRSHIPYPFKSIVLDNNGEYTVDGMAYLEETEILLRPMESMTEEEWDEYQVAGHCPFKINGKTFYCYPASPSAQVRWLLERNFDCNGMIAMGLAKAAPEGMYTTKTVQHMRAYKGFRKTEDGSLMCYKMEYEPGKIYKHEGKIRLCESGFHACHELCQVWQFYPNDGHNVFYEVECGGKIIESEDGSGKLVCSEIEIVKEIDMSHVQTFDYAGDFHEGFAVVELDGKRNFVNTKGNLLSEQWFDDVWSFHEGFAKIGINDKYNFISTDGKLLSEQWFDGARSFSECFAEIKIDGEWKKIDKNGKIL